MKQWYKNLLTINPISIMAQTPESETPRIKTITDVAEEANVEAPTIDLIVRMTIVAAVREILEQTGSNAPPLDIDKERGIYARIPQRTTAVTTFTTDRFDLWEQMYGPYRSEVIEKSLGRILGRINLNRIDLRHKAVFAVEPSQDAVSQNLHIGKIECLPRGKRVRENAIEALNKINGDVTDAAEPSSATHVIWETNDDYDIDDYDTIRAQLIGERDLEDVTAVSVLQLARTPPTLCKILKDIQGEIGRKE